MPLFKLTDLVNLEYASANNHNPTWVNVELTNEEAQKLVPISQTILLDTLKFRIGLLREEQLEGLFSAESLGYLPPRKIKGYYLAARSRIYTTLDGILLHIVTIGFKDEWQGNNIGKYHYWRPYKITSLYGGKLLEEFHGVIAASTKDVIESRGYDVLSGHVLFGDKPDTKYIAEDNSGIFIPITEERILKMLSYVKENSGGMLGHLAEEDLKKARKLVEASGLDLMVKVEETERYFEEVRKSYPAKHKQDLVERSTFKGSPAYKVELLTPDLEKSWQKGMEEYDNMAKAMARQWRGPGIDSKLFPYSLERLSTKSVIELMRHFADNGFTYDQMQQNMKIIKVG